LQALAVPFREKKNACEPASISRACESYQELAIRVAGTAPVTAQSPPETEAVMKAQMLAFSVLAMASGSAFAAGYTTPDQIAAETGLTARQVAMVLGPSTAYPEYLTSYDWVSTRLYKALGEQRYEELRAAAARDTRLPARLEARVDHRPRPQS
jgi:hypothetical protein